MEQEPGPRGSPHDPQGPATGADADAPFAETAKTDSLGVRFLPRHFGQMALSFPKTRASNSFWHVLHEYSKIGTLFSRVCALTKYKAEDSFLQLTPDSNAPIEKLH
jgi:hypothetical protein